VRGLQEDVRQEPERVFCALPRTARQLAAHPDAVWEILDSGARQASVVASQVLADVKAAIGLP